VTTDRRTSWLEVQIEIDPEAAEIVAAVAALILLGLALRRPRRRVSRSPA